MSNSIHSVRAAGRSILSPTLFGALSVTLRGALLDDAPSRDFADGQLIQQRGQSADGFWVIEEGLVLVGQFTLDGDFRAIAQLASGDSYGELAVVANNARVVDAIAKGDAKLRWVSASRYRAALSEDVESLNALVSALAQECQELIGVVVSGRAVGSVSRIAALLVNLLGAAQQSGVVAIGQQELGALLGLTRATVNKGLSTLEKDGFIERAYGSITVKDAPALRRLSLS